MFACVCVCLSTCALLPSVSRVNNVSSAKFNVYCVCERGVVWACHFLTSSPFGLVFSCGVCWYRCRKLEAGGSDDSMPPWKVCGSALALSSTSPVAYNLILCTNCSYLLVVQVQSAFLKVPESL